MEMATREKAVHAIAKHVFGVRSEVDPEELAILHPRVSMVFGEPIMMKGHPDCTEDSLRDERLADILIVAPSVWLFVHAAVVRFTKACTARLGLVSSFVFHLCTTHHAHIVEHRTTSARCRREKLLLLYAYSM